MALDLALIGSQILRWQIKCKLADHGRLPSHYGFGQAYIDLGDSTVPLYSLQLHWLVKEPQGGLRRSNETKYDRKQLKKLCDP